jgi:hypothetical protein
MPGAPRADLIGPVDVAVIAFDGDRFNGEVAPALADLQASGMVRLIDCGFVRKDKRGQVTAVEVVDTDVAEIYDQIPDPRFDLLSKAELSALAGALEPESSALVLVWENAWAGRLSTAIRESHGRVMAFERIPVAEVHRALADLDTQPDGVAD